MGSISSHTPPRRTVLQINKDGQPYEAIITSNLWVTNAFSLPRAGNKVEPLLTGKAYFARLIEDIKAAKKSIYIAGWQVNWDAQLAPNVRLYDVLREAAQKPGMRICVMPWNDTAPVQTFDDPTKVVLESLNEGLPEKRVQVLLAKSQASKASTFYSHHQKQVVIDDKIGYVGGIDLAYGRYDDEHFTLKADADGRKGLNRYNACVAPIGSVTQGGVAVVDPEWIAFDPKSPTGIAANTSQPAQNIRYKKKTPGFSSDRSEILEAIRNGAHQMPYEDDAPYKNDYTLSATTVGLDPERQPRQPWQDIQVRIEGPSVEDLTRNFVERWEDAGWPPKKLEPAKTVPPVAGGTCSIQVLRSASPKMDKKAGKKQDDILRAMLNLIDRSSFYIYIENQFFVSDSTEERPDLTGQPKNMPEIAGPGAKIKKAFSAALTRAMPGASDGPIQNQICQRLADRIGTAIRSTPQQPFHVYITLPVHSEGKLNDATIVSQVHWTMQTLVFGRDSLINRIRQHLWVRQELDALKHESDEARSKAELELYQTSEQNPQLVDIKVSDCFQYVTLLNLRNWAQLPSSDSIPPRAPAQAVPSTGHYVTEQIYVHSKLMIVDDRYAFLGSANINDRSLLGDRDSEIAVLIVDEDHCTTDIRCTGKPVAVRNFAAQLRQDVWKKLFGLTDAKTDGHVKPATELSKAVMEPANPASWKMMQEIAGRNSQFYEAAFPHIPRSWGPRDSTFTYKATQGASIWPMYEIKPPKSPKKRFTDEKEADADTRTTLAEDQMPFSDRFWRAPQTNAETYKKLSDIKGFITQFPANWTMGENNNMKFHNALITKNNVPTVNAIEPASKVDIARNSSGESQGDA